MDATRVSYVRIRIASVMLVRIDPGTEPEDLRLDETDLEVLRVRHPVPACTRMRVMRPAVVLVGKSVKPRDFILLLRAADDIGAEVFLVDAVAPAEGLHAWVVRIAGAVQARRYEHGLARSA
jgi:hypothetical protein